jgi:hypothetical protein
MENSDSENTCDDIDVIDIRKITTKMNRSLKRLIDIPLSDDDDDKTTNMDRHNWTPPETYGLSNSTQIVPSYFINKKNPLSRIPFIDIIKDDIRNMRPLTNYEMEHIRLLPRYELLEIINIMEKINRMLIRFYDLNDV